MIRVLPTIALMTLLVTTAAAGEATPRAAWRAARVEEIAGPEGWLTVVGLHWLKGGANRLGSARDNDIVLAHGALAPHAARLIVDGGTVRLEPAPRSGITRNGQPAVAMALAPVDTEIVLESGSLRFFVIERGGRYALRVRDLKSKARREFRGLEYFPVDPGWAFEARFEAYVPAHHVPIVNVLGDELEMHSPGAIVFERDGREWRLDALLESEGDDHLFVMFADATSGHETYGAGRFLHTPLPAGGRVAVDFNEAYNPPCAFTGFATCPLPPPQNRLPLAVRAGELRYRGSGH